jgi:leader peptidase (prepilin peptidase)/N-methyltransferase
VQLDLMANQMIWFAFIFGLVIGSFLNVIIHRLPAGESIVHPRSKCPQCGRMIRWFDNIPIFSYLLLRGKCRDCRTKIPLGYPAVEIISGVFAAFSIWQNGVGLAALWMYGFLVILLTIAVIDWQHQIIPDVLSLGGIVFGIAGAFICLPIQPMDSVIGAAAGAALILIIALLYKGIRKVDGMGGGDVKFMAMIGAFLGWQLVFPVLFIASFMGSIYGLFLVRSGGNGKTAVAFGSFLAPSAAVVFLFGNLLLELYLGFYPG